jgi:ketosteroid isomerase-like protein
MMTARCAGALVLTLFVEFAGRAEANTTGAASDPSADTIAALTAAINANDDKAVQALFIPDAVVFDEVTPYRWSGPNAARRWLHDDGVVITKNRVRQPRISIGKPTYVHRNATSVYTVRPLVDSYVVAGRPQRETGLFTIILVKRGAAWKISLLGFTKQSDTSDESWR